MATKEKVKKKATGKDDERPGSAHSQISVKEAVGAVDNTNIDNNTEENSQGEKFIQDENKQEKEPGNEEKGVSEKDKNKKKDEKEAHPKSGKNKNKKEEKESPKKKMEDKKSKKGSKLTPVTPVPAEDRVSSPAPSLTPSEEPKRSPSPYRKNKIDPKTGRAESVPSMGSAVSLKSTTSTVKEAWTDRENTSLSSRSSSSLTQDNKEDEISQNAYIPYLYARKCLMKVVGDLESMKENHIRIVGEIQIQYKEIEDETQSQFNKFVFCLRQNYSDKVKTFRQVIDVHRTELSDKETYWNEMLASLAERNNRLLKEKKVLLIQNKVEIERLEKEKMEITTKMTEQVDKANAALAMSDSNKATEDELKDSKNLIEKLKKQLDERDEKLRLAAVAGVVVASTDKEKETETQVVPETSQTLHATPVMAAAVISNEEKSKMSDERGQMEEDRQRIMEERQQMEADRENFDGDRKKWLDQINILQLQIGEQNKESAEWKVKYENMKKQAEDSATVRAKYSALESQYLALSAIVAASDTAKEKAEENAKTTREEKKMMVEEKQKMDKDIEKWEANFKKKNGRPPTEDDKSDSVKEMYIQKEELDTMVVSLETKLNTFEKIEEGKIPDAPEVAPVPVSIKDPEVTTVEVKVPDPAIVTELEKAQEEIAKLRQQILDLQQENTEKSSEITKQNEELSNQRDRIFQLENELAAIKAGAMGVAAVGASSEELDALKNENRELKKDMKKLMKKLEKTRPKDVDPSDPEERISALDDKITDLESDKEALTEQNVKLQEQVALLTQQVALGAEGSATVAAIPVTSSAAGNNEDLRAQLELKTKEVSEKDMKIQEQEQRIADKIKEIEQIKLELKKMRQDMMKMAKQYAKVQEKLKDLDEFDKTKKLLQAVATYVHEIHGEVTPAAEGVSTRLVLATSDSSTARGPYNKAKSAYDAWEERYKLKNAGKDPGANDRDAEGNKLFKAMEESKTALEEKKINVEALKIMKSGDYVPPIEKHVSFSPEPEVKDESAVEHIEHQMSALDNKVSDLEKENDELKSDRSQMTAKITDLEAKLDEATSQLELQTALAGGVQSDELSEQITRLQSQNTGLDAALLQEKTAHNNTKDELENLRKQMEIQREEIANERAELKAKLDSHNKTSKAIMKAMEEELDKSKARNDELEKERLANVPIDTAKEIKNLQLKIAALEKEKSSSGAASANAQGQLAELTTKLESANKNLESQRALNRENEAKLKNSKAERDKAVRDGITQVEKREQQKLNEEKKRIAALEKRIKELEMAGAKPGVAVAAAAGGKGGGAAEKALREQLVSVKKENNELNARIKQLQMEMKGGRPGTAAAAGAGTAEDRNQQKRQEKILKELEKKMEIEKKKTTKLEDNLKTTEDDLKTTKKDLTNTENELKKVKVELDTLGVAAKQGVEAATKVKSLETENKKLGEENKVLTENFNSERVLRRKYYNMVEDMKGKIRVYCRARPLSGSEKDRGNVSVLTSPDEFSINVTTQRGLKEFAFDQIFMEDSTQEKIFEDTNNLIQSAVDGYNVCIFAYGQTGSGKTFTMIGDKDGKLPGIAPRAFDRIFQLAGELKNKFTITVTAYMMELYNDKLIDLFCKPGTSDEDKMEIKKDKKGLVYVQGSVVKTAHNAKELFALFEEGSKNRHTASTKMNADSSRSHLVIGVMMESVNKANGQVLKGKLSLVDLAGSERVGKTGANAEQLKEAMSINKSLSALGDVISALSSEQQFIPYRNNKLTMLMQDSLGGNAKTLMFVNISPADYNSDESVISLMYASRVKLITNDASKNADNKEIARLKNVIAKLKAGEAMDEEAQ